MNKKIVVIFVLLIILLSALVIAEEQFSEDQRIADKKELKYTEKENNLGKLNFKYDKVELQFSEDIKNKDKNYEDDTSEKAKDIDQLKLCIKSSEDSLKVDSASCPELNKAAKIIFKGKNYNFPAIALNGMYEPTLIAWKVADNTYDVYVSHFSEYTIFDNLWNGTFSGTTLYNGSLGDLPDTVFSLNDDWNNTNETSTEIWHDYSIWNATGSLSYVEYHTDSRDPAHNAWKDGYLRMGASYNNLLIANNTITQTNYSTWSIGAEIRPKSASNFIATKVKSSGLANFFISQGTNSFTCTCGDDTISSSTDSVFDGSTWYNVTCINNGTALFLYKNGILNASDTSLGVNCSVADRGAFAIGSNSIATSTTVFHGDIKNVFLFGRALNSTEVQDPFLDFTDIILAIPLSDTDGITATDVSGNDYNATLRLFSRPVWTYNESDGLGGRYTWPSIQYNLASFAYGSTIINIKSADNPRANVSENFTVSTDFKIDSASNNGGFTLFNAMYSVRMSSSNRPIVVMTLANGSLLPTLSGVTCGTAGQLNNIIAIYANSSRAGIYCNNIKIHNIIYQGTLLQSGTSLSIGATSGGTATQPMGSISEFKIWDRVLSDEEMAILASKTVGNLSQKNIYTSQGNYTSIIYNSSDYDPNIYQNFWTAQSFGISNSTSLNISGRSGNCTNITSYSYTTGTYNSTLDKFIYPDTSGQCYQYVVTMDSDTNTTQLINNITITSYKVKIPTISYINLTTDGAYFNGTLFANYTVYLDDSDNGTVNLSWYKNEVINSSYLHPPTDSSSGQINISGFTKGDLWYFTAIPTTTTIYGNAEGSTYQSNNITISNTNYTIINVTPIDDQSYLEFAANFNFTVNVSDSEGDVYLLWYKNEILDKNSSYFSDNTYIPPNVSGTYYINLTITDGDLIYANYKTWIVTVTTSAIEKLPAADNDFSTFICAEGYEYTINGCIMKMLGFDYQKNITIMGKAGTIVTKNIIITNLDASIKHYNLTCIGTECFWLNYQKSISFLGEEKLSVPIKISIPVKSNKESYSVFLNFGSENITLNILTNPGALARVKNILTEERIYESPVFGGKVLVIKNYQLIIASTLVITLFLSSFFFIVFKKKISTSISVVLITICCLITAGIILFVPYSL